MSGYFILKGIMITSALAGLTSCTAPPPGSGPQGRPVLPDNLLNDWKLLCSDGRVIPHFYGTHVQAYNAPDCAPGTVVATYDNKMTDYGHVPPYLHQTGVIAIEPRIELTAASGRGAVLIEALNARVRSLRAGGVCAQAVCEDGRRTRYQVTYLDGRGGGSTRLDCAAAGLLNGPRRATRDVPGTFTRTPAAQCTIGVAEPAETAR